MRKVVVIFLLGLVSLLVLIALSKTVFKRRHVNVIIISVDTLRADHLGCYGYHRNTSPTIDKLAEEGALFKYCMVQRSSTCPSLTSIMTSLYPIQHGIRAGGYNYGEYDLTLAVVLKERGYETGVFTANWYNTPLLGFDLKKGRMYANHHLRDEYIVDRAIKWLKKNRNKKLFAWLHFMSVHKPYDPFSPYQEMFVEPNYERRYINGTHSVLRKINLHQIGLSKADVNYIVSLYDADIRFDDHEIKRFLEALKGLNLLDRAIIVCTADHGEDLYDHNRFFGHSPSIYDSGLRVPLIVWNPDKINKQQIDQVVESIDIAPTILELLDIPIPEKFEGKSLVPLICSDATGSYDKNCAFSEIEDKIYSIRTKEFRYISNPTEFYLDLYGTNERIYVIEKEELYDLTKDSQESNNIVEADRETASSLNEQLSTWLSYYQKQKKFLKAPLSEDAIRELKALGYI